MLFLFMGLIMSLASSVYRGEGGDYRGRHIDLRDIRSKLNVYDSDAKSEYNEDHTKRNVIMDNDTFDMFFRPDEGEKREDEYIPTKDELKAEENMREFEDDKDKYLSFLRKEFGITR